MNELTSFSGTCSIHVPVRVMRNGPLPSMAQGTFCVMTSSIKRTMLAINVFTSYLISRLVFFGQNVISNGI